MSAEMGEEHIPELSLRSAHSAHFIFVSMRAVRESARICPLLEINQRHS